MSQHHRIWMDFCCAAMNAGTKNPEQLADQLLKEFLKRFEYDLELMNWYPKEKKDQ